MEIMLGARWLKVKIQVESEGLTLKIYLYRDTYCRNIAEDIS
jgi:hypothetical protein